VYCLGRIGEKAGAATGVLTALLDNERMEVRGGAAHTLAKIGPPARAAVPALVKASKDQSREVREVVIAALRSIGVVTEEVLAVVFAGLTDPAPELRREAVWACGEFGPKAGKAVPELIKLLDDKRVNNPGSHPKPVVWALGRIGPEAKAATPKLLAELKDPDIEHATVAAAALLGIGVEEKAAVRIFATALDRKEQQERSHIHFRTLDMLERVGPAAKPVVPILLGILKDRDEDEDNIRNRVAHTLLRIDPEAARKAGIE
jgi:HEAT repeat protein